MKSRTRSRIAKRRERGSVPKWEPFPIVTFPCAVIMTYEIAADEAAILAEPGSHTYDVGVGKYRRVGKVVTFGPLKCFTSAGRLPGATSGTGAGSQ